MSSLLVARSVGAVLLTLLIVGCGDDDPASNANANASANASANAAAPFLCDNRTIESRCFDYWAGATRIEVGGSCDGVVTQTACTGTAVGRCAVIATNAPYTGKTITAVYYAEGPGAWTTATAEANCTQLKGSFSR